MRASVNLSRMLSGRLSLILAVGLAITSLASSLISSLACSSRGISEARENQGIQRLDLFALIDRLVAARPLTKAKVERLTGVSLEVDAMRSNPYFALYVSARAERFFERVELREAREGATRRGGLLILDLDPLAVDLQHREIPRRYGESFSFQPPSAAPSAQRPAPAYYQYREPWGELRFGFGRSDGRIEAVVIDAER